MSSAAFYAADTLGMTLYQLDGKLVSSEIRPIRLGPWNVNLQLDAVSDLVTAKGLTFWLTLGVKTPPITPLLQFYLIVREKESWMIALDAEVVALAADMRPYREGLTIPERMDDLEPAIKAMYHWTVESDQWDVVPKGETWWWK